MANYSGLFESVHGDNYELLSKKSPNRYHLNRLLKKRDLRELGEVMFTLLGASAGSSASKTHARVQAVSNTASNEQGGVRTIESINDVGLVLDSDKDDASAETARNTTAADVTTLTGIFDGGTENNRAPATYPTDASGNGGGGKGETIA